MGLRVVVPLAVASGCAPELIPPDETAVSERPAQWSLTPSRFSVIAPGRRRCARASSAVPVRLEPSAAARPSPFRRERAMPEPHFMAGGDFENVQAFVSQAPAALAEVPIHECNVLVRAMRRRAS